LTNDLRANNIELGGGGMFGEKEIYSGRDSVKQIPSIFQEALTQLYINQGFLTIGLQEAKKMIKQVKRLAVLFFLGAMEFPMMASVPNFIAKQGKGVFLFNVAVILIIAGFAGYLVWKKKNNDGGDE
jgi:hypothetical protein